MKKRFKAKRKLKTKYKSILIIITIIILLILILNYISNIQLIKQNALKTLAYSNNLEESNIKKEIIELTSKIIKIDINKPTTILKNMMYYEKPNTKREYYAIENKKEIIKQEPLVYIYNTHQTEEYIDKENTVLTAAHYLKEKLEQLGISTIVEEKNIKETIEENNLNNSESYKASRINLENIKNKYPNIKIFIDLHRDSIGKNLSTTTIGNKECAKVLFVIGKEHNNYAQNLEFTSEINNLIIKNYPQLTKGILEKEGPGVNGIYNQDIGVNVILMEVGGFENTFEEVKNTLDIMSNIIKEKIYEE